MKLADVAKPHFRRHDSFAPRYGWFRKAFVVTESDPRVFSSDDRPVRFGVGINMVNAIRTWGLASEIIHESQVQTSTPTTATPTRFAYELLGEKGWDRFVEDQSSLWLLHWRMMAPMCTIPVWWLAFNEFEDIEFSKDELEGAVTKKLADTDWLLPHPNTIKRDLETMLLTYAPPLSSDDLWSLSFREFLESPLRRLRLIEHSDTYGFYRFNVGPKLSLPSEIITHACLDFAWRIRSLSNSISVRRLAEEPGTPGRVFKIAESEILTALRQQARKRPDLRLAESGESDHTLSWSDSPSRIAELILGALYRSRSPESEAWLVAPEGQLGGGWGARPSGTFTQQDDSLLDTRSVRDANSSPWAESDRTAHSTAHSIDKTPSIGIPAARSHANQTLAGSSRQRASAEPDYRALLTLLEDVRSLQPAVAARHSARHDLIRVFSFDYALGGDPVLALDPASEYDGKVLLMVGGQTEPPPLWRNAPAGKPTLAVIPDDLTPLLTQAAEVNRLTEASAAQPLNADLTGRIMAARAALRAAADEAFSPANSRWVLLGHGIERAVSGDEDRRDAASGDTEAAENSGRQAPEGRDRQAREGSGQANIRTRTFSNFCLELPVRPRSETLSQAADIAYPCTPELGNEMINSWPALTTQGKTTRTKLLRAMVDESSKRDLGFDSSGKHYPAKLAMYRSVLHRTGLHRYDPRGGKMVFGKPTEASLRPAWNILSSAASSRPQGRVPLDELHLLLLSPPVGMRKAAIAVFITAWMLAQGDRLKIFSNEREVPLNSETALTMAKRPERFELDFPVLNPSHWG